MMIVPRCSSVFRITPCQIRKPASVTTNEGTPTYATIEPWNAPIAAHAATAMTIASRPFSWWPLPASCSSATIKRADAREVADREVDLAEQEHEDHAEGEHRRSGGLADQVGEVDGGEEVRRREAEDDDDDDLAEDDREGAEVPRPQVEPGSLPETGETARELLLLEWSRGVRADDVRRGHGCTTADCEMPETFVGTPAVIASTTACWVVVRRSNTPTSRPSRSTVMRSAVSKTS